MQSFRSRLKAGETIFGTITLLQDPAVAEIAGYAGYDFIVIDTEHTATNEHVVQNMVRASVAAGISPIVRVRQGSDVERSLGLAMDMGSYGVMVPMVELPEQALAIRESVRFPPEGKRTLCVASRGSGWASRRNEFDALVKESNEDVLTSVLIETRLGVENAGAIVDAGIDVVVIGRADLSMQVGSEYAPASEETISLTKAVIESVVAHGGAAGILAYDVEDAKYWMDAGCQFIMLSEPEQILSLYLAQALSAMRSGGPAFSFDMAPVGGQ